MKLIMTKGLPASGKTTWAKEQVKSSNGKIKRISKDDLRAMLDNSVWSKENEANIIYVRDFLADYYLRMGWGVIIDDTGFNPVHERTLRRIADSINADFEIRDFNTPLEECIQRDAARENSVGEKVIRDMYEKYLKPKEGPKVIPQDPDLPRAILCDIDGTLAINNGTRTPYEWHRVGEDDLCYTINHLIQMYQAKGLKIVLVSGRDGVCRQETEDWLDRNGVMYDALYMREANDNRKDVIVKQEIYDTNINGRYNVHLVLDDRDQVVKMWRANGLKCLQVAEGSF